MDGWIDGWVELICGESLSISTVNRHCSLRPFSKQLFLSLGSFEIESVSPELSRKEPD